MNDTNDKDQLAHVRLLLEAAMKKRVRLTEQQKAHALLMGWKLRGRGRPRQRPVNALAAGIG